MEILARQTLAYPAHELADVFTGSFDVVFDNQEKLTVQAAQMVFTRFIWDILARYPETPILPQHHIAHYTKKRNFNSKTTIDCYTAIFRSVNEVYKDKPGFSRNEFMRTVYEVNNNLYNHMHDYAKEWSVSLDILDFKEILDNQAVRDIKANLEETPDGVDKAQKEVVEVLMKNPELDNSVIARGVRAGILSSGQVAKCIGPCGYFTDIDSHIFPKPVLRGYAEGIRSFYDSIIESRSGAKSLQFSKRPLQDTEYFSRRLQLVTKNVRNLHHGDCGSTRYLLWFIRPDEYDEEGNLVSKGDLPNMLGKKYLDEETGTLKTITEDSKHLIGKMVKLRSVFHCNHDDPYGICSTCFGDLSYGVPTDANLGHLCAVSMASPISQAVLSVKHLDGTAVVEGVYVSDEDRVFLLPANGGHSYKINPTALRLQPKLIIPAKDADMLTFIEMVEDVRELNTARITNLEFIQLEYLSKLPKKNEDLSLIPLERRNIIVSSKRRLGNLTHDFLEYMKKTGWTYDAKKNLVVDLSGWDTNKVFIDLPFKHHNMADHAKEIENLIESKVEDSTERSQNTTPADLLVKLFELVNSKAAVNMSILEVILYSTMVVDSENYDYSLPKERTQGHFVVSNKIVSYRSLSAAMAFQGHAEILSDPINFLVTRRPNHVFDALVTPELMQE